VAERIARVYVDRGLPHLDTPADYAIPSALDATVRPGVRVRVPRSEPVTPAVGPAALPGIAGAQPRAARDSGLDGWVVDVVDAAAAAGALLPLLKVVSPEPVLPPATAALVRAVADHCGGTFCDVARLAVPPRHATTEKAEAARAEATPASAEAAPTVTGSPFDAYPTGPGFLAALAAGQSPRAAWTLVPTAAAPGDWADGLAAAAAATYASGRSAVLVVPDAKDADRLAAAVERRVGRAAVARQSADLGPAARYRGFLRALHGEARVVVGTRAAAYAPVADLGLVALWDDGDDSHSDRHAPYPHSRDVLALRVTQEKAAALFAAYSRTTEVQAWVEAGWLTPLELPAADRRRAAPRTAVASQDDHALAADPAATVARVPHDVFTVVRDGLAAGPVLVQVPRAGFRRHLFCARCGAPVRCACGGPLAEAAGVRGLACAWCGRVTADWTCPDCHAHRVRAATVGHRRTAEELARAFPGVPVRRSDGDQPLLAVPDSPALVVATPGTEPAAPGGYAAAVLLDAAVLLGRANLRAGEEALRRWLQATALVRPGDRGGTALLVGPATDRTVQAWLRLDPAGCAARELADRAVAGLPPAVRVAAVTGEAAAVADVVAALRSGDVAEFYRTARLRRRTDQPGLFGAAPEPADRTPAWLDVLGPVPDAADPGRTRVLLRADRAHHRALATVAQALAAARSAAKAPGQAAIHLDPDDL
jgi:primosomal protein N' (replication factor Y)